MPIFALVESSEEKSEKGDVCVVLAGKELDNEVDDSVNSEVDKEFNEEANVDVKAMFVEPILF